MYMLWQLLHLFTKKDELVFSNDGNLLLEEIGPHHNPEKWRLFIDSPKTGLKVILHHIRIENPAIPIAHAVNIKAFYQRIKVLLDKTECQMF